MGGEYGDRRDDDRRHEQDESGDGPFGDDARCGGLRSGVHVLIPAHRPVCGDPVAYSTLLSTPAQRVPLAIATHEYPDWIG